MNENGLTLPMAILILLMVFIGISIHANIVFKKQEIENERFLKLLMDIDNYDPEKHGRLKDYNIKSDYEIKGAVND